MTNMEMINALNALAQQTPKMDMDKLYEKRNSLIEEKRKIRTYRNKYYVSRAGGKTYTNNFSFATDKAYYALIENLSEILPSSETDGQVGKSFYLSTDPEKNEFVRVTVSRTNGVTAGSHCETTTVEDAQEIVKINTKLNEIDKLLESTAKIEKLCKTLARALSIFGE